MQLGPWVSAECDKRPVVNEKCKSAQWSMLGVVDHGELWLKWKRSLMRYGGRKAPGW